MRKLYLTLALVLCLAFVVFAFASCGKEKKPASTTTDPSACVHEWGEYVVEVQATCKNAGLKARYCKKCDAQDPEVIEIPTIAHTESADYKTISAPTCKDVGWETKYCTQCFSNLDDTLKEIPADVNAHELGAWTVVKQPTLLDPTDGSRTATCKLCNEPVNEVIAWTPPMVYLTNWDASARAESPYSIKNPDRKTIDIFGVKNNITKLRGENGHYYPDDTNENQGNDLLVEFSFLYNDTMANATEDATLAVMYIENHNLFDINLKDGKITAKVRTDNGGDSWIYPTDAAEQEVSIGEYGWHRFGMRIHQTTSIDSSNEVKYTVIATAYLDGVKILELDKTNFALSKHNGNSKYSGLLYTAEIEDDHLVYKDLDADGHLCDAYIMVEEIDKNENDPNAGYLVVADLEMSCGQNFKQSVEKVASPAAADPFVAAEGVNLPAKIYYKAK